jgi:hypothetical protein
MDAMTSRQYRGSVGDRIGDRAVFGRKSLKSPSNYAQLLGGTKIGGGIQKEEMRQKCIPQIARALM